MKKNEKKIHLFIMTYKGYIVLHELINAKKTHIIASVISSQDINIQKDYYEEIQDLCIINKIPFFDKKKEILIKDDEISIAIGWRWMINSERLIVLHDSLLPRYRGFAPLVNALINGDTTIGVTALFAVKEFDKGDVINQKKVDIDYPITINEALNIIAPLYAVIVNEIVDSILADAEIKRVKQSEQLATYSVWRNSDDYIIDWYNDASYIKRFIDAVGFPYLGAVTFVEGKKIIIKEAIVVEDVTIEHRENNIGKILFLKERQPIVICKNGLLQLQSMWDTESNQPFSINKFRLRFAKNK